MSETNKKNVWLEKLRFSNTGRDFHADHLLKPNLWFYICICIYLEHKSTLSVLYSCLNPQVSNNIENKCYYLLIVSYYCNILESIFSQYNFGKFTSPFFAYVSNDNWSFTSIFFFHTQINIECLLTSLDI